MSSLLEDAVSKLEHSSNFDFEIKSQNFFNIAIFFEPQVIKYLQDFQGKIVMNIPKFLRDYVQEIELIFNHKKYSVVRLFLRFDCN